MYAVPNYSIIDQQWADEIADILNTIQLSDNDTIVRFHKIAREVRANTNRYPATARCMSAFDCL